LYSIGSLDVGFTWEKDQTDYDYDDAEGEISIDLIQYIEGDLISELDFIITDLISH
jgi:hypothetical protein